MAQKVINDEFCLFACLLVCLSAYLSVKYSSLFPSVYLLLSLSLSLSSKNSVERLKWLLLETSLLTNCVVNICVWEIDLK